MREHTVAWRSEKESPLEVCVLRELTRLGFPEPQARLHWRRVWAHWNRLRDALGRDVGLGVAAFDYFVNVEHHLADPVVIERARLDAIERSAKR